MKTLALHRPETLSSDTQSLKATSREPLGREAPFNGKFGRHAGTCNPEGLEP